MPHCSTAASLLLLLSALVMCVVSTADINTGSILHFNTGGGSQGSTRAGWGSPRPTGHAPWAHALTEEEVKGGQFDAMKAKLAKDCNFRSEEQTSTQSMNKEKMCGGQGTGWPSLTEEECGGRCGECPDDVQASKAVRQSAPPLREKMCGGQGGSEFPRRTAEECGGRCGWCKDEEEAALHHSKSTVAKANAWLSAAERILKSSDSSLGFATFSRLASRISEQSQAAAAKGLNKPFMKLTKAAKKERKEAFSPRVSKQ